MQVFGVLVIFREFCLFQIPSLHAFDNIFLAVTSSGFFLFGFFYCLGFFFKFTSLEAL